MGKKILIILTALLLCACSNKNKPTLTITDKDVVIEYGDDEFDVNSLIIWGNFDDLSVTNINVFKVGKQDVTFTALKDGETIDITKEVEIIDTQFPTINEIKKEVNIPRGKEFNVNDYVKASDPVDGKISLFLSSGIDINQPGNYSREVIAKDRNGNESKDVISINVKGNKDGNEGVVHNSTNSSKGFNNSENSNETMQEGVWTEVYEESWSSSGSYEVDSSVNVEHKVE